MALRAAATVCWHDIRQFCMSQWLAERLQSLTEHMLEHAVSTRAPARVWHLLTGAFVECVCTSVLQPACLLPLILAGTRFGAQ